MTPFLLAVSLVVGVASERHPGYASRASADTWVGRGSPGVAWNAETQDADPTGRAQASSGGRSLATPALIYSAAAGLDYASTRYALDAGARERNPLMQSHARLVGWKAAQVLALTLVDIELQKRGYRNKARVLRITAFVIGAGLAIHNVNVARRMR